MQNMPTFVTHLEIKPVPVDGVSELHSNKLKAVPKIIVSCNN